MSRAKIHEPVKKLELGDFFFVILKEFYLSTDVID